MAGTRTSVKKISANAPSPTMSGIVRTSMPGVSIGISRMEMPACFGTSVAVRTRTNSHSAEGVCEVQIF